jgi:DNA-binding LytR/AlgR family response regulator
MPGVSGLDLLRALPQNRPRCVVFLTAHEEYALEAFNVEAIDSFSNPLMMCGLDSALNACGERYRRTVRKLILRDSTAFRVLLTTRDPGERSDVFPYEGAMNFRSFLSERWIG